MSDLSNKSLHDYDYDYGDEICEKGEVVRFGAIAIPVFFSVVITLSLSGNILVLVILAWYENLKSLTNIFIFNLAMSDLIFTSSLPFWAIYHIWGWLFSDITCKIVTFIFFAGFYSSILFLTVMTIYRYVAVVHPLSDLNSQRLSIGGAVSGFIWIISIAAATPSLLHSSLILIHHKDKDSLGCEYNSSLWRNISTLQQNIIFLVAFVVMAFCYIQILVKIRKSRSHTKNRAVKLVFCIVAVFFVGWVPYNVVIFLRILAEKMMPPFEECKSSIQLDYVFYVCRLSAFSHCCLNPVFYAFVGVKFRRHLKSMLHQLFSRQSPGEEQQVRMQNVISQGSLY